MQKRELKDLTTVGVAVPLMFVTAAGAALVLAINWIGTAVLDRMRGGLTRQR
jgi:hypothetical protein